jgi:hypothetical protein
MEVQAWQRRRQQKRKQRRRKQLRRKRNSHTGSVCKVRKPSFIGGFLFGFRPTRQGRNDRLFEDHTILVPNRHIFHLPVSFAVAGAVMLDFDNYASDFTHREIEHVLHNGRVFAAPSDIAD